MASLGTSVSDCPARPRLLFASRRNASPRKAWRDEQGKTWLEQAPAITMLTLVGHQREPRPLSWSQQHTLLALLPRHLASMSLFALNTGVRDDVVCSLRWAWEIAVPELGISVFEVPREHVKGRRRPRLLVCNSVAQAVVEAQRGRHKDVVFVWRAGASRTWTTSRRWPTNRSRR